MIDSSANTLFQLLRLALGNKVECVLPSDINWQSLIDLSFNQGVAALAVDGFGLMAHDCPDLELEIDKEELEDLKYEWFGAIFQAEEDYFNTVKAAEALAKKYPFVILKGLSIARKYPIPEHRKSVDLDVFINENDDSTGSPTEENGLLKDVKVIRDDYKHTGFMYKGVMVEYHKSLIAWKSLRDGKCIEKTLREALKGEGLEVRDEGIFANDYFNALFVAVHSYTHFMLEDGISLKHIIDWFLLCTELRERISKTLETFGMREFAESMTRVAKYVCKEPSTELTNTDQRMLDDILSLGKKKRFKNGHLNMAYNILFRNGWKFKAFAKESNLACLIRCGWNSVFRA